MNLLREPPKDKIISAAIKGEIRSLNELVGWFRSLFDILGNIGGIPWLMVDKTGSRLDEIETRPHADLQDVAGWASGTGTEQTRHISDANGKVWQDHVETTDGNPHGTDHAMLDGLGADDHAQYLLLAGRPGQTATTPLILGDSSNNTTFETDGTPKFNGDASNWNDINISVQSLGTVGATVLDILTIGSNKLRAFIGTGAQAQQADGSLELLHDYKEGSEITPHIHWMPEDANAGNVKWQMGYRWFNRGAVMPAETVVTATQAAPGVQYQESRVSFPAIDGTGKTIGSRFVFRVFRDPADAADTYAHYAIALDFGMHYERDTIGSRQITAK